MNECHLSQPRAAGGKPVDRAGQGLRPGYYRPMMSPYTTTESGVEGKVTIDRAEAQGVTSTKAWELSAEEGRPAAGSWTRCR